MNTVKIGILGGIGPQATGYFYVNLINRLKEGGKIAKNADYPQIIINSINAPELTSDQVSEDMLKMYITGVKELAMHKPDFIVMVCNTIHLYRDEIIRKSKFSNILSIRDIVKKTLTDLNSKTICILATPSTVKSGLYKYDECIYENPEENDLVRIGKVVDDYNSSGEKNENRKKLVDIMRKQQAKGAQVFLTACTEVSELLHTEDNIEIIDTLDILLDHVLERCLK